MFGFLVQVFFALFLVLVLIELLAKLAIIVVPLLLVAFVIWLVVRFTRRRG